MKAVVITSLHGLAHCRACGRDFYSSGFLSQDVDEPWDCPECAGQLEGISSEPFGDGPLFVPTDWAAPDRQR